MTDTVTQCSCVRGLASGRKVGIVPYSCPQGQPSATESLMLSRKCKVLV